MTAKWKTVKIGSFLKERLDRFKPAEANSLGLKRIEKIDFQGNIHISDITNTKTNMILVKSGDLIISGINAEKGAVSIYQGVEGVLATIHYSSYEFDASQIDIEYFKWFLRSRTFKNILLWQVGGGIKTELKPKKLLPLEIQLPDINTQRRIITTINNISTEIDEISYLNNTNQKLVIHLRQSILQEAIQGKLVDQNSDDEPASVLLEKIREEKERLIKEKKIKKENPLPPITEDEIPFGLPKGWEWVRLGSIGEINPRNLAPDNVEASFVPMNLVPTKYNKQVQYEIRKWREIKKGFTHLAENDVAIAKITPCFQNGKSFVAKNLINGIGAGTTELYVFRGNPDFVLPDYAMIFLKSPSFMESGESKMTGTAGQQRVPKEHFSHSLIPLPPISEQRDIVKKINQLMAYCEELEDSIKQSKQHSDMLMTAVLQDAFSQ